MAIIFGADTGIRPDAFSSMIDGVLGEFGRVVDGLADNFGRLSGKSTGLAFPPRKETVYVDDGFQNVPGTVFTGSSNIGDLDDVKTRRITTQTPQATVYIKKRLFSSLRNEHDTRFMDNGEKAFVRASKLLFERKCSQIAAYEAMTKLERLIDEESELDVARVEAIANIIEESASTILESAETEAASILNDPDQSQLFQEEVFFAVSNLRDDAAKADLAVEELRRISKHARVSKQEVHTSWVIDTAADVDRAKTGRGVGVIELTLVDNISTQLSIEYGSSGSITFSVQDPYNLTLITSSDIEMAVNSAISDLDRDRFGTNVMSDSPQSVLELARRAEDELKATRNARLSTITLGALDPTNPLSGADLAEIIFEVNPSSQADHKITGHFAGFPEAFNSSNFPLVSAQLPAEQRLDISETILVSKIFGLLEEYVNRINRLSRQKLDNNDLKTTDYARRQLRKHYLGKSIIQPMDGVNVFMRSNSVGDGEISGPLNALLNSSAFVRSFAGDADATDAVLQEEMRQFGIKNIPVAIYKSIRTDSLMRNAGTHVFGGLIGSVGKSYNASSGQYTLNVAGESNLKWLGLSRVNITPSLDQPRGVLEDPITPLEIETDAATGLITGTPTLSDDNIRRLGSLYYRDGVYVGDEVSQSNMAQDVKFLGDKSFTVRQHAPGLVYKWKEGVISVTQQRNLRTALDGASPQIDSIRRDVGVTVTQNSFANLDVADVISLLVTGFPHNYESFVLNAQSVGSFTLGLDDNVPDSFFGSLMDITRSTNRALGNFEAYKSITVTREQMAQRLLLQTDLIKDNKELATEIEKVARLQDLVNQMSPEASIFEAGNVAKLKIAKEDLIALQASFAAKIKDGESQGLRIYGNDIVVDSQNTSASDGDSNSETNANARLRSELMQIRSQVDTKLNRDRNLFVVSDEYDKDLDLQAFVTNLASSEIPIWNSEYKNPREICINAAKVIDFEFFCDTAGNIQFRPPQYNKMPISLLSKMLLLSQDKNIDLLPPFVRALFKTRRESLEATLEVTDIDIQINDLFLFRGGSGVTATNLGNTAENQGVSFEQDSGVFISGSVEADSLGDRAIANEIRKLKNAKASMIGTETIDENSDDFKALTEKVAELNDPKTPNVNVKRQKIVGDSITLNSKKQRVTETLAKMSTNQVKDSWYNDLVRNATAGLGSGVLSEQISTILEPFGNLLEDDSNDFLGPGSSRRFIIRDESIISYDFKESDANVFCRVDVTGQEDFIGVPEGTGEVADIPLIWAGATDFDLWKQYGWRAEQAGSKPFFKDAESQCAPYALMLLARQRKDIVRATLTVVGNEYYQLGDVVYLNSMDMLYYVYEITHNFSYSGEGKFQTTLDLRYGHPLGEFIPTPLDVIGKNIIKNQRKFNTTFMFRNTAGAGQGRALGAIVFIPQETKDPAQAKLQMLGGDIGGVNLSVLKNALLVINRFKDNDAFNKVEIRGWARDNNQSNKVVNRINAVKEWLLRPTETHASATGSDVELDSDVYPPISKDIISTDVSAILLPTDDTELEEKDIGRTPSEESYNFMKNPEDPKGEFNTIEIVLTFKE